MPDSTLTQLLKAISDIEGRYTKFLNNGRKDKTYVHDIDIKILCAANVLLPDANLKIASTTLGRARLNAIRRFLTSFYIECNGPVIYN